MTMANGETVDNPISRQASAAASVANDEASIEADNFGSPIMTKPLQFDGLVRLARMSCEISCGAIAHAIPTDY